MDNITTAIILTAIIFGVAFFVAWLSRHGKPDQKVNREHLSRIEQEHDRQLEITTQEYQRRLEGSYKTGKLDAVRTYVERTEAKMERNKK